MFEHLATADLSDLKLKQADGTPLGYTDKEGVFHQAIIKVRSRVCEAVRQHDLQIRRKMVAEARKDGAKADDAYDPEEDRKNGIARLEVIIAGWDNLPDGKGGKLKFTEENKHKLAAMSQLDYIHRQIFQHHKADENFMPAQPEG